MKRKFVNSLIFIFAFSVNFAFANGTPESPTEVGFRDIKIGSPESVVNQYCSVAEFLGYISGSCFGLDDLDFTFVYSEPEENTWTWDDVDDVIGDLENKYGLYTEKQVCDKLAQIIPGHPENINRKIKVWPRFDFNDPSEFQTRIVDIWGEEAANIMALGLLLRYGSGQSASWQFRSLCDGYKFFIADVIVGRYTLQDLMAYYSPLPQLPVTERVVEQISVDLGVQAQGLIGDLLDDPTNQFNQLRRSLGDKYYQDWGFGRKEVESFIAGETDELWTAYENGQVFLKIEKVSNWQFKLKVEYHTIDNGEILAKDRKPNYSTTSDF